MMKKIFIALKFAMIKISSGLLIQIKTMKILAVINTKERCYYVGRSQSLLDRGK